MRTRVHMIGNAHLDPAWMWTQGEGLAAFKSTLESALERLDETPAFVFTASSAAHFEFIEIVAPDLFKKVQDHVKAGRIAVVGGWWVEPDCNLPSGESFIRQGLYGQRYFLSRFGRLASTGYNIDSFGHNANLPQLLHHCGLRNYVWMRPETSENPTLPRLIRWTSQSGEHVASYHLPLHYSNFSKSVDDKLALLPSLEGFDPQQEWMLFYGVGNHGGGPTREQIRQVLEPKDDDTFEVLFSDPDRFFECQNDSLLNRFEGELQPHAIGCYSAHSEIKRLNREVENALLMAEKMQVMLHLSTGRAMQSDQISQCWKNLLFNQFHDLLGGVSIREACSDAVSMYREALARSARVVLQSSHQLAHEIDTSDCAEPMVVFNPIAKEVIGPIEFELWHPHASERGEELEAVSLVRVDGSRIQSQKIQSSGKIGEDRARFVFLDTLPPLGWNRYDIVRHAAVLTRDPEIVATDSELSNGHVGIDFRGVTDARWMPYTAAAAFDDSTDTWGHDAATLGKFAGDFEIESLRVIESGPIRGRVRIRSSFKNSWIEEDYILYCGSDQVELRVRMSWQEEFKLCRLRFAHRRNDPTAVFEIPYATLQRPADGRDVPGLSWVTVKGKSDTSSFALINTAKYSYSADSEFLSIIAARSPLYAHHVPPHTISPDESLTFQDQGIQEFRIALIPNIEVMNSELAARSEALHQQPILVFASARPGALPPSKTWASVHPANVHLTVLKPGEDGGIVVRLTERDGVGCSAKVRVGAIEFEAEMTPYCLKTYHLVDSARETNGLEL